MLLLLLGKFHSVYGLHEPSRPEVEAAKRDWPSSRHVSFRLEFLGQCSSQVVDLHLLQSI